jgi:hypothetical protein
MSDVCAVCRMVSKAIPLLRKSNIRLEKAKHEVVALVLAFL